ncbi:MAG TPA: type 4a pilus biogenesis protein PilO, partial [Kofleriaceae bacterium]|nr:type 4a pilus biogenesis protein PilO [Kofleriaceae bacterium]
MAGFVSDFARRPRGFKVATFAGIGAVLGLAYWQLAYQPVKDQTRKYQQQLDAERSDQRQLKKDKRERLDLVTKRDGLAPRLERDQKALPTEAEMPAFFDMLSRKISEAGVEAMKRETKKEITIDPNAGLTPAKPANAAEAKAQAAAAAAAASAPKTVFLKVPVEIEISGTFYQLKRFFSSLRPHTADDGTAAGADKDRLVTIENLALVDPRVRNSDLILTARFTASTFRAVT